MTNISKRDVLKVLLSRVFDTGEPNSFCRKRYEELLESERIVNVKSDDFQVYGRTGLERRLNTKVKHVFLPKTEVTN